MYSPMRPPRLPHGLQNVNSQMERLNSTTRRAGVKIHPSKTKVINAVVQEEVIQCTLKRLKTRETDDGIIARRKKAPFPMLSLVWRSTDLCIAASSETWRSSDNNISKESTNLYQ